MIKFNRISFVVGNVCCFCYGIITSIIVIVA